MIESFVSAYRGCPDLLVCLLGDPAVHDDLSRVLTIARDRPSKSPVEGLDRSIFALSPREKEVLSLLAQGLSNPAIGVRLFISPATVKAHVHHIFEKLGVKSRAEAALRASQLSRD
jgi:DNA-binding NarL/FixJ family response regulator